MRRLTIAAMSRPSGDHVAVLLVCLTDTEKSMMTSAGPAKAGNLSGSTRHVIGVVLWFETQHDSVHTHCKSVHWLWLAHQACMRVCQKSAIRVQHEAATACMSVTIQRSRWMQTMLAKSASWRQLVHVPSAVPTARRASLYSLAVVRIACSCFSRPPTASADTFNARYHVCARQEELLNDHVESHFFEDSSDTARGGRSDSNGASHQRACPYGCGASLDDADMDSHMLAHQ